MAALPRDEQDEVIAYLFHVRHADDSDYEREINGRLNDKNASHWLSPDEFESRLDRKKGH